MGGRGGVAASLLLLYPPTHKKAEIEKGHTVEYKSIDYYSMCEKSKAKIKAMQDAGFSTPYDAKSTPEETEMPKMGGYSVIMMGK